MLLQTLLYWIEGKTPPFGRHAPTDAPSTHPLPTPTEQALEMDSKQFVKLCRDAGLLDSRLTATAADLAFVAKAKPLVSGMRRGV